MSGPPEIVALNPIIEPFLKNTKIISHTSRYLTKNGENYGGVVLSIVVKVRHTHGEIENLQLIAKLPPLDAFWQIFQPERTFLTECSIYIYFAPAIRQLQLNVGLKESQIFDCFARYYGSRVSLDPNVKVVDKNAVLVQENLQTFGYKSGKRGQFFDIEHAKFTLSYLAKFHALALALRLKESEAYDHNLRPYLKRFNIMAGLSEELRRESYEDFIKQVRNATNNDKRALERAEKLWLAQIELSEVHDVEDDIFITIVHNDLWMTNIMFKYDGNDKLEKLKLIDFQIAAHESLPHDIIFFLLSNLDLEILEFNFDEFLHNYYEAFIDCLKSVNVSTAAYSYDLFHKEVLRVAPLQLQHVVIMAKVIMADNSHLPDDFSEVNDNIIGSTADQIEVAERTENLIRLAIRLGLFY